LIFHNGDRIGYISLDNKDRLEHPGKVIIEFPMSRFDPNINYIVRMLIYKENPEMPLAITCHRVGDTTDCDKISFERCDVVLEGAVLEQFLRQNLFIWLKEDNSRRI